MDGNVTVQEYWVNSPKIKHSSTTHTNKLGFSPLLPHPNHVLLLPNNPGRVILAVTNLETIPGGKLIKTT